MRLKRTLVSAIAALGLAASIMTPVAMAGPSGDSATAQVSLTEGGEFNLVIDEATIDVYTGTAEADTAEQTVQGSFNLTYTDTKSYRPSMTTSISATDFLRTSTLPEQHATVNDKISNENFFITVLHSPAQTACCRADGVGGISVLTDPNGTATSTSYAYWSGINLSTSRNMHIVNVGSGTVKTTEAVDFEVVIPANMAAGVYRSTVTLTVTPGTP